MFCTGSGNSIQLTEIPDAILAYYRRNKAQTDQISIIVGTDSQNFNNTKMVSVIAVVAHGHGGIFFYEVSREDLIQNVKLKLQTETAARLTLAGELVDMFEGNAIYREMFAEYPLSIHIDAGNSVNGKTKDLIPGLVSWIRSCGYDVETKPNSFVASTIADRITK